MLILELAFTDSAVRLAARPAHRQRLTELHVQGQVLAAGPWADDSGAVLIFDATRAELDAIMAADPYYTTPGVQVVSIRDWTPVVVPSTPGTGGGPAR
ncbi:YciI family protein [Streptomyces smyrnaeus]|uniref:YciI family protein n=1 Tax=Streptomyces smyrnaeus TaxID=1387713 RepID=UPI0037AAC05B